MSAAIACSTCGKALPPSATFCDGCGARVAPYSATAAPMPLAAAVPSARPGFVAVGRGMAICHGCGAIAPTRRGSCEVCDAAIGTSLEAVPLRDDRLWAQLRTSFTCRQCGQRSPMDPLDLDGTVTCSKCHAVQAFDVTAWHEALEHAHAVADLGPPERRAGIAVPFGELGVSRAIATVSLEGMTIEGGVMRTHNLTISAAPGQPLCDQCGCPIEIQGRGGEVEARCGGCGARSSYRFHPDAGKYSRGFVAAIGDELRSDRPAARLDSTSAGAVIAVHCPSCGGNLDLFEGKPFTKCGFCGTHCRIPQRTLLALHRGRDDGERWWALFSGSSNMRTDAIAPPRPAAPEPERAARSTPRAAEPVDPADRAREPVRWALAIGLPVLLVAAFGMTLFRDTITKWSQDLSGEIVAPDK